MELRQYQIHGHTSPSVFIVEYVAWLCIVVEGSMLMQSTECGENLIGDICIDFSQTFQDQLLLNQPERKSRQFEVMRKVNAETSLTRPKTHQKTTQILSRKHVTGHIRQSYGARSLAQTGSLVFDGATVHWRSLTKKSTKPQKHHLRARWKWTEEK
ncbi:hypothetical protein FLAG1_09248 [Fusarium langsethiae]|uniref:Uncharacterized protein n=1 Tax=Fusarium langsethiae TaxID=179993 RepID=A0A0N0V5F9_FUSLA|nr:hypothetical protein FLAG1_09248 [Fusarium langsethiae]